MIELECFYLEEIAEFHNSRRIPLSSMQRANKKGIYPYYGASGIVDYIDDYIYDGSYILISEDGENLKTRKTPIAFEVTGKFWVNNHAHILKTKDNYLTKLIIYYFSGLDLAPYLTGAVQPKLNKATLSSIPLYLPKSEKEQKTIASVLSSLDDKIDLLHRQNKTLEAMAETLFRQWFIEEAEDDWLHGNLGELLIPRKGKNITRTQVVSGKYPVVAGGIEPSCYHNTYNTNAPVVTISASGANAGYVRLYYFNVWSSDSSFIDSSIYPYIYFSYIFLKINQSILFDKQEGSAQPHIYPSHIMDLELLVPPETLIKKFEETVTPLFLKVKANIEQIQTLENLRDTLLPKLMSGEVRVKVNDKSH